MLAAQIVSAMTVTLCMLIDSIMIGRFLGVDAMAAYGYTAPVLLAFAAPGAMIAAGVQVVCGRTMGSGDRKGTDACFTVSVRLTLGLAVFGLALVLCFAGPLCTLLGAGRPGPGNPVFALTKQYLTGFIIGVPAFLTAQIMVPYLQMAGDRKRLVAAVVLMTVSDVIFDLLNVFVFHGGTFGMGLASSLSYYAALLVGSGYFLKKDCLFHLQPWGLRLDMLRAVLTDGVPTVVNQLSLVLLVFLLNRVLRTTGGNMAVAAYSVVSTVSNLCYAFSSGIGSVALMLAAIFYADEDRSALLVLVKTIFYYAVIVLVWDSGRAALGKTAGRPVPGGGPGGHEAGRAGTALLLAVPCTLCAEHGPEVLLSGDRARAADGADLTFAELPAACIGDTCSRSFLRHDGSVALLPVRRVYGFPADLPARPAEAKPPQPPADGLCPARPGLRCRAGGVL